MPMASDRHYVSVSASSSVTSDHVVPNGKVLTLYRAGGDSGSSPDTIITITWDPGGGEEEVVLSTHTQADQDLKFQNLNFTGNGTKKLQIKLTNDQVEDDDLGAFWEGKES